MHIQVEHLIRKMTTMPQYIDGEYLPREVDLASQLGISRNTVRQATNKLELEGIIVRKKGLGTRVAHKMVSTHLHNWHSFTQEMAENGVTFINYMLASEITDADEKISRFFNISEGTSVVVLKRLRGDEDGPFVYFESYFHPRIGITRDEDFTMPLYDLLEEKYNAPVVTSREKISARKAIPAIARRLKIHAGEPILVRERFVSGPGDRAVEYNIGYYVAEKFTYTIEIQR
jgi:GntR family transcriptional regulator